MAKCAGVGVTTLTASTRPEQLAIVSERLRAQLLRDLLARLGARVDDGDQLAPVAPARTSARGTVRDSRHRRLQL